MKSTQKQNTYLYAQRMKDPKGWYQGRRPVHLTPTDGVGHVACRPAQVPRWGTLPRSSDPGKVTCKRCTLLLDRMTSPGAARTVPASPPASPQPAVVDNATTQKRKYTMHNRRPRSTRKDIRRWGWGFSLKHASGHVSTYPISAYSNNWRRALAAACDRAQVLDRLGAGEVLEAIDVPQRKRRKAVRVRTQEEIDARRVMLLPELQHFEGGATRSQLEVRYDLIPPEIDEALAQRFALGASTHGENNWKTGGVEFIRGCINHLRCHLASLQMNGPDHHDDDVAAMIWNAGVLAWFRRHKPAEYRQALATKE